MEFYDTTILSTSEIGALRDISTISAKLPQTK